MDDDEIDEDLPELATMVFNLVGDAVAEMPPVDGPFPSMRVESVTLELPVELRVRATTTGPRLLASPPLERIETTILPVWHRLTLRVVEDHAG
jgi:hypothetical protein